MLCFLKDHCNRLLSHCSVKGCDFFFPIRQTQRRERRRKTILGVSDHFLDLGFLGLIDLSTSFIKLEYIFILMMVLLGSRATNPSVEFLLNVFVICYASSMINLIKLYSYII